MKEPCKIPQNSPKIVKVLALRSQAILDCVSEFQEREREDIYLFPGGNLLKLVNNKFVLRHHDINNNMVTFNLGSCSSL